MKTKREYWRSMKQMRRHLSCIPGEEEAIEALEYYFWKDKPKCPYCGKTDVTVVRDWYPRGFQCNTCRPRKQFNVLSKTSLRCTKIPVRVWFEVAFFVLRGIKPKEYAHKLGLSYRDARSMEARLTEFVEPHGARVFEWALEMNTRRIRSRSQRLRYEMRYKARRIQEQRTGEPASERSQEPTTESKESAA